MKVSIITVVYNGAVTISDCMKSVFSQTYPNIEYIVIDGNSTDGTQEIVKKYGSKIAVFLSEKDKGIYDAMNKGIALASGDIVGILNADDWYANDFVIERIVKKFQETGADAVYADLDFVNPARPYIKTRYWRAGQYKKGAFLNGWMPPHPTFFVKKESYQKYGAFRIDFGSAADYELMLRFCHKHEIKLAYLPETITIMQTGGASSNSFLTRLRANRYDSLAWKVNQLSPRFYTVALKPIRKIIQFIR